MGPGSLEATDSVPLELSDNVLLICMSYRLAASHMGQSGPTLIKMKNMKGGVLSSQPNVECSVAKGNRQPPQCP